MALKQWTFRELLFHTDLNDNFNQLQQQADNNAQRISNLEAPDVETLVGVTEVIEGTTYKKYTIDFATTPLAIVSLEGPTIFAAVNYQAGRTKTVRVEPVEGSTAELVFPEWVFVGGKPTEMPEGLAPEPNGPSSRTLKIPVGILTATCFGSERNTVAAWSIESN